MLILRWKKIKQFETCMAVGHQAECEAVTSWYCGVWGEGGGMWVLWSDPIFVRKFVTKVLADNVAENWCSICARHGLRWTSDLTFNNIYSIEARQPKTFLIPTEISPLPMHPLKDWPNWKAKYPQDQLVAVLIDNWFSVRSWRSSDFQFEVRH